jgi:queuine tRNA-ribosyltransferase
MAGHDPAASGIAEGHRFDPGEPGSESETFLFAEILPPFVARRRAELELYDLWGFALAPEGAGVGRTVATPTTLAAGLSTRAGPGGQPSPAERATRWSAWQILVHEYIHTLAHPAWDGAVSAGGDVMNEGFCEMFTAEILDAQIAAAGANAALRAEVEGNATTPAPGPDILPASYTSPTTYQADRTHAENIRARIGPETVRAAYFQGHIEFLGLEPGGTPSAPVPAGAADICGVPSGITTLAQLSTASGIPEADIRTANPAERFTGALPARLALPGCRDHRVVAVHDRAARAGVVETPHGPVETPVFMPVGTQATVKTLAPTELGEIGARFVLANSYHLFLRPGADLIERLGGLHRFMAWDGPILTDSGGFQVFSLRDTILAVDDEGVTFRSVYDGAATRLTPELVARIQANLGSDIAMCLDVCPPAESTPAEHERAVRLTTTWATRQHAAPRAPGQLLFGIAQGGVDTELRTRSIEELTALRFDGYALGGLAVGETREEMFDAVAWSAPLLPADLPRYFMGIGDPEGILGVIERGVDMFDCVLPTRTARTGSALTWEGRLNLRNARFARDPRPLDEDCPCSACARFSRAYLRHLLNQDEILGLRLLTLHNLRFVLDLTAGARAAIERGELASYAAAALARLTAEPQWTS